MLSRSGMRIMFGGRQTNIRNRLLARLSRDDFELLRDHLHPTEVALRTILIAPQTKIERLFFPESGFISITTPPTPRLIEVGLIGREGLVGAAPVLLGDDRTPYEHFVQSPGQVMSIGRDDLLAACGRSASLKQSLLVYVQALWVQTAHTAFVNAAFDVETRLARWLLMCQDRLDAGDLALTHEFLAMMLGVQRTSVTLALQVLEGRGWIKARRGRITVLARAELIQAAAHAYGFAEAEYERLMNSN